MPPPQTSAPAAPDSSSKQRHSELMRSGAVLGIAVGAANLLHVVFHVVMARMLKPAEYSLLASLLAIVMIFTVPTLALQAAVAREVASRMADEGAAAAGLVLRQTWRWLWRLLLPVFMALTIVSLPIAVLLDVRRPGAAVATALTLAATAVLPVVWGGLQGTHKFGLLGGAQAAFAAFKLALGVLLVALGTGAAGVMFGIAGVTAVVAAASLIPLIGLWRESRTLPWRPIGPFARYAMTAGVTLALFAAMTNADLLVARVVFSADVSGIYAAASLTGRTILLLPMIVTTLLFPRVAVLRDRERERRYLLAGLTVVGVLGLLTSAVLFAVPTLFLRTVFGPDYVGAADWIGPLAIGMTLYALVQVYTYHCLSLDRRRYWALLAVGLVAQTILFAFFHSTPMELVWVQVALPVVLLAASEVYDRVMRRRAGAAEDAEEVELPSFPAEAEVAAELKPPGSLAEAEVPEEELWSGRPERRRGLKRETVEALVIFFAFFAIYAVIGHRVVVEQHVVVFDALSRLAHAFFVWHNEPPKLAAVGFEWPPIMTLVLLPAAIGSSLGKSPFALTLTSAVFASGLLVVLSSTLRMLSVPLVMRAVLILLFGLNPIIVFYATNGMGEAPYLFFLSLGVFFLLKWHLTHEGSLLALAGMAMAIGGLTRYEILAWGFFFGVAILVLLMGRRARTDEIEASLILYFAPITFGVSLWCFFNWLIIGNPLFWLERQAGSNVSVGRGNATQAATAEVIPIDNILRSVLELNVRLFPLVLLAAVVLIVVAVVRRNLMSAVLAGAVTLNAVMTTVFVYLARDESLLQLRYNLRVAPLALVGMAWAAYEMRRRALRWTTWLVTAAVLVAGIPLVWHSMKTFRYQFMEASFISALETGEDQEGTSSTGGFNVGIGTDVDMSDTVLRLTDRRNSVLTDDAQSFSVMLLSGQPDIFFDRIDRGDKVWKRVLERPWGRVRYLLVTRFGEPELAKERYPDLLEGGEPGFTLVHQNARFSLFRVAERPPVERQRGLRRDARGDG